MNQSEYNKQIEELKKMAKFGRYIYGMKLHKVYPCDWSVYIKNAEMLAQECLERKDNDSFTLIICDN